MNLELFLTALAATFLLLLSTFEGAYDLLSEVELRVLVSEHQEHRHGRFLAQFVEEPARLTLSLGIGRQLCIVSIAILLTHIIWTTNTRGRIALAFVASLAVIVVFRELLPHLIAQNQPSKVLIGLLPSAHAYARLTIPVLTPVYKTFERFRVEESEAPAPEEDEDQSDELQALIDVGEEAGIIEAAEGEMIQSIMELSDRAVSEVMTPRTRIVSIPASATVKIARDAIVESKYSRLPVYRESLDNIIGIVYVRDLLRSWQENELDTSVTKVMRPAYFVPETKPVRDQLEEMQKSKVHAAIVIDEYGTVAGLLTIEDLLEEIVGEIEDEDRPPTALEETEIAPAGDDEYLVKASTEIRKIELLFEIELAADDFTTVAGLVIKELGHMPAVGEELRFRNLRFRVAAADNRRIDTVRIRRLPPPEAESQESPHLTQASSGHPSER